MADLVDFSKRGAVGVITVNNPPVNALSVGVPKGICEGVAAAEADAEVKAIVVVGGGRAFIAGADISEFFNPPENPTHSIFDVLDALEGSAKLTVAGIHGNALGGGLEVALSCHYRCGHAKANYGLPEVKLGLLPGAGGTQRLPRLIGVERALPMIASGSFVNGDKAAALGIIDAVAKGNITDAAVAYAEGLLAEGKGPRKIRGTVLGSFALFGALGILIATSLGGRIFDHWMAGGPFVLMGVINSIVLLTAIIIRLKTGKYRPD